MGDVTINIGTTYKYGDHDNREFVFRLGWFTVFFPRRNILKMNATLPDDKVLPFVAPTAGADKFGNPTALTGVVKVTSSDTTVATVVQPDPTTPTVAGSGVIAPTGKLGTFQVTFEDDTDGPAPLLAILTVSVVAGATVGLVDPTIGAPRDPS